MQLLNHTPTFDPETACAIAAENFGLRATARVLPSERDQNFLLTNDTGEKFVLKIANALESRDLLEAQNAVLAHLAAKSISFCPRVMPSLNGELISKSSNHLVRLMTYLPGVPLAEIQKHSPALLCDLGRTLGRMDRALADFDHPAVHRDFHWDLANGNRVIDEYHSLVESDLRELVLKCRFELNTDLRRSVIHGDANDYNVLVESDRITGLIDFGDMVYSWTVGNLAIALAYVVLGKDDPFAAARPVIKGYAEEFTIHEPEVLWSLVRLRLAMSVCLAAHQRRQRPKNKYLDISQRAIAESLPKLFGTTDETD